jgi:hypothetical protein
VTPIQLLTNVPHSKQKLNKMEKVKEKVKFALYTCHEDTDVEQRYNPVLSLTSALDDGGWLTPCCAALPTGLTRYLL